MDCSLPGSSIHGIFQARVQEWGAIAFSCPREALNMSHSNVSLSFWFLQGIRLGVGLLGHMAPHSSTLAWKIPGTVEPDGLPSMGSHRVGHDCGDLAAAAVAEHGSNLDVHRQRNG